MHELEGYIDKIGLGTVQFGLDYGISNKDGHTDHKEVQKILSYAKKVGIKYIDTAYAYGNSQNVLGTFELSSFNIISKYLPENESNLTLNIQFNESLESLNQKRIYGFLAHRASSLLNKDNVWEELQNLKSKGLVEKIGVSLNEVPELEKLIEKDIMPDLIQIPYNFFDRRFEKLAIDLKMKHDIEIHSRSTFLQGLFFIHPDELPPFFNPIKDILIEMKNNIESLTSFLLLFVLKKTFVDKTIIGVNNLKQLQENIKQISSIDSIAFNSPTIENSIATIPDDILTPSKWPKL